MDNQQGPTARGTLLNVICQPRWEGSLGENEYKNVYGGIPPYSPETITTLSISCTLTQNRKFKKRKKPYPAVVNHLLKMAKIQVEAPR